MKKLQKKIERRAHLFWIRIVKTRVRQTHFISVSLVQGHNNHATSEEQTHFIRSVSMKLTMEG